MHECLNIETKGRTNIQIIDDRFVDQMFFANV